MRKAPAFLCASDTFRRLTTYSDDEGQPSAHAFFGVRILSDAAAVVAEIRKGRKTMHREPKPKFCTIPVGSVTRAMRARDVLALAAIPANVVSADAAAIRRGCAYAVALSCDRVQAARRILRDAGFSLRAGGDRE